MNNIKSTNMTFTVSNDTNTASVTTTGEVDKVTGIEFNRIGDFTRFDIDFNGIVDTDVGVGVTNGTTIVGNEVRNTFVANLDAFDFAEFVFGFFGGDAVDGETAFGVVDETEVFAGFFNGDDICLFVLRGWGWKERYKY